MNRIRTIASAGIVAGSVAFAAALLSSGGVGASFVDAAEASASITVADQLDGLEPLSLLSAGCDITIDPAADGLAFTTDAVDPDSTPFDLTTLDINDAHSVPIEFTISAPGAGSIESAWTVRTDGDLQASSMSGAGSTGSITFTWTSPTSGEAIRGTGTIIVTCTPQPPAASEGDDGGPTSGDTDGTQPDPEPTPATYTYTLTVGVDIPAAEPEQARSSLGDDTGNPLCTPNDGSSGDAAGCSEENQTTEPDCAPGGADAADPVKCPTSNAPEQGDDDSGQGPPCQTGETPPADPADCTPADPPAGSTPPGSES